MCIFYVNVLFLLSRGNCTHIHTPARNNVHMTNWYLGCIVENYSVYWWAYSIANSTCVHIYTNRYREIGIFQTYFLSAALTLNLFLVFLFVFSIKLNIIILQHFHRIDVRNSICVHCCIKSLFGPNNKTIFVWVLERCRLVCVQTNITFLLKLCAYTRTCVLYILYYTYCLSCV